MKKIEFLLISRIRSFVCCWNDEVTDGERLKEKGITYATDYVINAGGLISVYSELKNTPHEKAMKDSARIFDTVKQVLNLAREQNITTTAASNQIAEKRLETISKLKRMHV